MALEALYYRTICPKTSSSYRNSNPVTLEPIRHGEVKEYTNTRRLKKKKYNSCSDLYLHSCLYRPFCLFYLTTEDCIVVVIKITVKQSKINEYYKLFVLFLLSPMWQSHYVIFCEVKRFLNWRN